MIFSVPGGPSIASPNHGPGSPAPSDRSFAFVSTRGLAQPPVDASDLIHPLLPVAVFQVQDVLKGPMEVICQVGYLLVQAVKGVAYDPPSSASSTSCLVWQAGHVTVMTLLPCSLI